MARLSGIRRPYSVYNTGLTLRGATSLSGEHWVRVKFRSNNAWVRFSMFTGSCREALQAAAEQGVIMPGADAAAELTAKASYLDEFPAEYLADRVGWNGGHFALPDGTTVSPENSANVRTIFRPLTCFCSTSGSMDEWKSRVAALLVGQPIPMFALMSGLAAPLLNIADWPDNPAFELIGSPDSGITTAQQLACSVLGKVSGPAGYGLTFNAVMDTMANQADLPLIVTQADLFFAGEPEAKRATLAKPFAARLSRGRGNSRAGAEDHRFLYFGPSGASLAALMGSDSEIARLLADKLISLEVASTRPFGIFDRLPDGFTSTSEFTNALVKAASENHGHAIRLFLARLVQERAANEAALRSAIEKHITTFRLKARVDQNDGAAAKVADAFGLVYAAGKLAQRWGIVPDVWRCGSAVLTCYTCHLMRRAPNRRFEDRLEALAAHPGTMHLRKGSKAPEAAEIKAGCAFIRHRSVGRELVVRQRAVEQMFPDWRMVSKRPEVQSLLIRDGEHLTTKRTLGSEKGVVAFCFRLPIKSAG